MAAESTSATLRTFSTPELLEQVLVRLLADLLPVSDQEDPRNVRTHSNARVLKHLLRCSEVHSSWFACIRGSNRLQRALFLVPDNKSGRAWSQNVSYYSEQMGQWIHYRAPSMRANAPVLNPIIQVTFPAYHYRFWHLSLEASGNRHCAYLIITRRDLPAKHIRSTSGQGRSISSMLLSQPPCCGLEATIWEERDETKDYLGRTFSLKDPIIRNDEGLTIGMVHDRVAEMFAEHPDVAAIKLTTA